MTRSEKIRRLLEQGPSTSGEIADSLKIRTYYIRKDLKELCDLTHVERVGSIGKRRNRPRILYALTPRGLAKIRPWRVGSKIRLNVYEGERPVCQCHTVRDALRIVEAMNRTR